MNAMKFAAALTLVASVAFAAWLFAMDEPDTEPRHRKPRPLATESIRLRKTSGESASPARGRPDTFSLREIPARGNLTGNAAPLKDSVRSDDGYRIVRVVHLPPPAVPVLPFAFRELPAGLELEPAQTRAVEEVQDQFIKAIGGEAADPATPEYRKKWLDAQRLADLQLRARIGGQAFAGYQRASAGQTVP